MTSPPTVTSGSPGPERPAPRSHCFVPTTALAIDLDQYDRAIDERTAVVMVNRVLYRSSAIVDAKAVCSIARSRCAVSFVDDYHGVAILTLDLHELGCDF